MNLKTNFDICQALFLSKKCPKQVKNVHFSENSEFSEPTSFLVGVLRASRNSEYIQPLIRKSYRIQVAVYVVNDIINDDDDDLPKYGHAGGRVRVERGKDLLGQGPEVIRQLGAGAQQVGAAPTGSHAN